MRTTEPKIFASDRNVWLAERRKGIGASEIPILLGLSGYSSPIELYLSKVYENAAEEMSEAASWGLLLEDAIAEEFGRRLELRTEKFGYIVRHAEFRFLFATPDHVAHDGAMKVPIQVKTTGVFNDGEWQDGAPMRVVAQVHQEMMCLGSNYGYAVCLIGGQKMVWQRIERNENLCTEIASAGSRFWQHVQDREPPQFDVTDLSRRVSKLLWPESDGSVAMIKDAAHIDIIANWRRWARVEKEAHESRETLYDQVLAIVGPHERVLLPSGAYITAKSFVKPEYVVRAHTERPLRYYEPKDRRAK